MKVTKNQISDTRVEIKVVLDAADLKDARKKAIARLAKDAKVPGFRAGKAPAEVAEKSLDPRAITDNTLDIAVRTTVPNAFHEASSQPLVIPEVNVTKYVPDEMLDARGLWADKDAYDAQANKLATMFSENFAKKYPNMPAHIVNAGPKAK